MSEEEPRVVNWRIAEFTDEDAKRLEKIIQDQPELRLLLEKREAHRHVFRVIRSGAIWITTVLTVVVIGTDAMASFLRNIIP